MRYSHFSIENHAVWGVKTDFIWYYISIKNLKYEVERDE